MFLNIAFVKKNLVVFSIITIVLISIGGYKIFFGAKKEIYNFDTAKIGNVVQEVSAVGRVKKGELINLGFKDIGKIDKIYIKVGDEVNSGQELANLETTQLFIQLKEARAASDLAQAELNKLLAGATPEEIKISRTAVENAEISLANSKQDLEDTKAEAQEDLEAAYEDALNVLEDAYLKAYNAFNKTDLIQRTYFNGTNQECLRVIDSKKIIEKAKGEIKSYLDLAKTKTTNENIDIALSKARDYLDDIAGALGVVRNVCEESNYRDTVSDSDKTALDNHKSYINTALTNVINSEQTISLTKLTNESNLNTAQGVVSSSEGTLKAAQDELSKKLAGPRQEDVDLYQAKLGQVKAKASLLEEQILESVLKSPTKGQITKINKEIGEQILTGEAVVSLIPTEPFQVETDISESDIGKIKIGNYIKIVLDAFPEEEFSGKVVEIDPAETVIAGVIYYKIKASLETEDERIKPGMTANLTVIIDSKENVLTIPQRAVIEKNGKKFTRILKEKDVFEEIEIQTGLKGSSGVIEILSGLKEGDKVITSIKEQ